MAHGPIGSARNKGRRDLVIGIFVGVLIGVITGVILLVLLKTVHGANINNASAVVAIVSEIAALPTFWFGGPWLTTTLLQLVPLNEFINPYIISLCLTFLVFIAFPILKWIGQMARDLGKEAPQ
jgi:hypothetical protein